MRDIELTGVESLPVLPPAHREGFVKTQGENIWDAIYGDGLPVVLLHGGMGHSGNWIYQALFLVAEGFAPIVVDSRGHGRITFDGKPFAYKDMAEDVLAVLDAVNVPSAAFVGWSDGAITALLLARDRPEIVERLFYFACNVDPTGIKPFVITPMIEQIIAMHRRDYARLLPRPDRFDDVFTAIGEMQSSQPILVPKRWQ